MKESADQLILEYLAVAADVAHRHLGSRERLDFMTRLRKRIEEHRRGSTDPAEVRKVLARFGDPERLVLRERRRLDGGGSAGDAGGGDGGTGGAAPVSGRTSPPARTVRGGGRTTRTFAWDPAGATQARRAALARRAAERAAQRSRRRAPGQGPGDLTPAGSSADPGGAADLGALVRRRPLEVGALGLLWLGGLLLPIPLWLFGAGLVGYSRAWAVRDKLIGLAGPLVVTGIGVTWYAAVHARTNPAGAVADAIIAVGPMILRFAGPAGAIHLGMRLLRGTGVRSLRVRRRRY